MESDEGHFNDLPPFSPIEEPIFSSAFKNLPSPDSEKSDNGLSDFEEDLPREVQLSELYGRTPPSSRTATKPSKGRSRSTRRKRGSDSKTSPGFASWQRRQSASAMSTERAYYRVLKEEESSVVLVNGQEEVLYRRRNRSLTESSVTRKTCQRKFQCLRYKESGFNAENNLIFKEEPSAVCPLERVKFYETLNMLVNLGQGGSTEGKEKIEEETGNYEVEELQEALWLELQAWRNSTTMLDQDEWLMNERKKINTILDNVIYFHVDKTLRVDFEVQFSDLDTDSDVDDDEDGFCCLLHPCYDMSQHSPSLDSETNDLAYFDDTNLSTSPDCSATTISTDEDTYKLSDFAQTIKKAIRSVTFALNKLYYAEHLYPSRGALRKDFQKYSSDDFQTSYDTLLLWLNQIKGLYHKLHVMSQLVHVDFDDEKVWKDWIDLGIGKFTFTHKSNALTANVLLLMNNGIRQSAILG